jgi:hypothetical protein
MVAEALRTPLLWVFIVVGLLWGEAQSCGAWQGQHRESLA